jgi:hypothetical protein
MEQRSALAHRHRPHPRKLIQHAEQTRHCRTIADSCPRNTRPSLAWMRSATSYRVSLGRLFLGHVLKGEKPGDLPVQQEVKVELALNLKAAKTLGLTFPGTTITL